MMSWVFIIQLSSLIGGGDLLVLLLLLAAPCPADGMLWKSPEFSEYEKLKVLFCFCRGEGVGD